MLIPHSCALLDIHRPDLMDYDSLDKSDHRGNMQLAFDIASKEIGIPDLLDVEDVCDVAKPDERSLMTYIAYWFHAFSQMERVENAGRRVEKFVANMQGAWQMQNDFERRMRELLDQIAKQRTQWEEAKFDGTYTDARNQSTEFTAWKRKSKRTWVAEKSDLVGLLGNIRTKLATYRLRPYDPPADLSLEALDTAWTGLMKAERQRSQVINETIRDIKNALRKSFADKANDFALALNTLSTSISALEGDVEDQLEHTKEISKSLAPLDEYLNLIASIDEQCAEANIEENDFTTYTYDELEYELGLVRSSVSKKLAFLENQMVARNMTNLTPIQLEEFESVFRHFDRDVSNSLAELEFSAALASLGLVYDEEEMHERFRETSGGKDYVTFEQFIRFMVDETEDQNTAEQVFESFKEVADGKVSLYSSLLYSSSLSSATNSPSAIRHGTRSPPLSCPRRSHRRSALHNARAQRPRYARGPRYSEIRLHHLYATVHGCRPCQRHRCRGGGERRVEHDRPRA
jgi:Ca2+-binding EF-hand superfamily protein